MSQLDPGLTGLKERYENIQAAVRRIAGDRAVLLAVSKGQSVDAIEALYRLGHRDFAENYAQELVAKARELGEVRGCAGIRWHFIGHLQTNKVKMILPWVHAVHTLDSEKLARELFKVWKNLGRDVGGAKLPVFLEVNIDREPSKSGLAPEAVPEFAKKEAGSFFVEGLMCIPAADRGEAETRAAFRQLRELEAKCRPSTHGGLSMGMSSDYVWALEEGSTHVRVGTALFGPRNAKRCPAPFG